MKAYRLQNWKSNGRLDDIPVPEPGPSVEGFERRQPVLVMITGCGHCHMCAAGWNNYCLHSAERILASVGGLAEYLVAPADGLVLLDRLTPWKAVPLTDAGLTSFHCVKKLQLCASRWKSVAGRFIRRESNTVERRDRQ